MSEPESMSEPSGESAADRRISEVLRTLPIPEPTSQMEQRVRFRLRQRRLRRFALAGSIATVGLLAGLMFWQPRMGAIGQGEPRAVTSRSTDGPVELPASTMLDAGELSALFALPPVDSLGVLDRRQKLAFNVLEHGE